MKAWRVQVACVGLLLCVGSVGCVRSTSRVRMTRLAAPTTPKRSLQGVQPGQTPALAVMPKTPAAFARLLGQRVLAQGERLRKRAHFLHETCNRPGASPQLCQIYWQAQKIFAINYRAKRRDYRGYMMFHWRRKRSIPRHLMRWHQRISKAKYQGKGGRCFLDQGQSSSCMGFAMCAVRQALQDFRGPWGDGFVYPTWGYVNYWTNQAYYAVYHDYQRDRVKRVGIRTFMRTRQGMTPREQQRTARQIVQDMHGAFMRIVRRKLRGRSNRRLYRKLFCTNMIAGVAQFSKAQPGDLFAIAYAQKRSKRTSHISGFRFQHWGIVADPATRQVLHNQTPGGLWGRKFARWGIQYGNYSSTFAHGTWKWKRRRKRYEKRVVFFNRLNAHFFVYARRRNIPIYRPHQPALCDDWIARYGETYLGISPTDAAPDEAPREPLHLSMQR